MYMLLTSSRGSDDLSIGFDCSRDRRKRESTNIKTEKGKFHLRIYLKDRFGSAQHQKTAFYGLGYKLTLIRNTDNAVLNKNNTTPLGKVEIDSIEWHVPQYTPGFKEFNKLMNWIKDRTPRNLHYPERSIFMKEVITQNLWTFELGTQEVTNVPIWVFVIFKQSDREHDQNLNNDTFYKIPVTSAQCFIETDKISS